MSSKSLGFFPPPHLPSPSIKTSHHNQLLSSPNGNVGLLEDHLSLHSNSLVLPPPPVPRYNAPLILPDEKFEEEDDIEISIVENRMLLSELGSWGIGGPCKYFLKASRPSQIVSAVRYCRSRSIDYVVIGNGSNCLFSDRGFDGLVILNRLNNLEVIAPGIYKVGSGYPFNKLGVQCSNEGYSGLEFAGGIPGTVGGAAFMNAGADGQETANVIDRVDIMTLDGRVQELRRNHLAFGYRWSSFQEMVDLAAITNVTFKLTPTATAREQQRTFLKRRIKTQPIGQRSAGSVFKNPLRFEISAGELIDLAGLKGYELGGARVSDFHANFFINYNSSTSWEMLALINFVKERVFQIFGIELREEIKYVPYISQII